MIRYHIILSSYLSLQNTSTVKVAIHETGLIGYRHLHIYCSK